MKKKKKIEDGRSSCIRTQPQLPPSIHRHPGRPHVGRCLHHHRSLAYPAERSSAYLKMWKNKWLVNTANGAIQTFGGYKSWEHSIDLRLPINSNICKWSTA
ncbi:unnamed protein product [Camellia sinensis]